MEGREPEKSGKPWGVIVIGGGITGAGVLREAARQGLSCLLLEQRVLGGVLPAGRENLFTAA